VPSWDDVRSLGLALPGVSEETSYGTPALKVDGKLLVRLKEDGETLALRVAFEERQALVHAQPEVYSVAPHYESYPMVLVRLAAVDLEELGELLVEAWLERAPARVVAAWEAGRA
jgi:hypothetical protein